MNEHAKEIVPSKRHVEFDAPLSFPPLVLSMNVCLRVWRWNKAAVVREGRGEESVSMTTEPIEFKTPRAKLEQRAKKKKKKYEMQRLTSRTVPTARPDRTR